jgi:hypothetical protein
MLSQSHLNFDSLAFNKDQTMSYKIQLMNITQALIERKSL